ncbi:MAG: ATP-binding cassette domain-containing protein [Candidatus Paceibacterota bacterium]
MKTNDTSILAVEKLTAGYGSHIVLEDVSFELNKGEVLGIIGQNGSGKSTLLKAMSGLIPIKGGYLIVNGKKKDGMISHRLLEIGISYFTQGGLVMPALTVEEHLSLAHVQNGRNHNYAEQVYEELPRLFELRKQRAGSLSGGERQMLSFGILIAQNTNTWFLDEPTAGLSPQMAKTSIEFLLKKQEEGISILLVEHNMEVVFALAKHVMIAKEKTLTKKFNKVEFNSSDFTNKYIYN